jgi:hypothetical protein
MQCIQLFQKAMLQCMAFYFMILKHWRCSFPAKSNGVVALVMSFISAALMPAVSSLNFV